MSTPVPAYLPVQRRLHWIMAALILALILVGLTIPTIQPPEIADPTPEQAQTIAAMKAYKNRLYDIHKWTGIVVLGLLVWRLAVRLRRAVPKAEGLTPFERTASTWTHRAIYALMLAMPLTGWASSSALGFPIVLFGVIPLPDWAPRDAPLGFALLEIHQTLAWALIALLVVHVAAVGLHVWKGDRVLGRMTGPGA